MKDEPAKTCQVGGNLGWHLEQAPLTWRPGYPSAASRRPRDPAAPPVLSGDTFGEMLDV